MIVDTMQRVSLRVNADKRNPLRSVAGLAGKVALSLLVLYALLWVIRLVPLIGRWAGSAGRMPAPPGAVAAAVTEREEVRAPWPRFPGNSDTEPRENVINGVRFITQDAVVPASAGDVIAFYKSEMSARGWRDTTEEFYGIQPDMRDASDGKNSLQDPGYLELYRDVTDSSLVMRKDEWSFHVLIAAAREGRGRLNVRICAADTPSILEFYETLALTFSRRDLPGRGGTLIEASETSGGNEFHTRWSRIGQQPEPSFQEMLKGLVAEDWSPVAESFPRAADTDEHCALLVKKHGFAYLRVSPSPDGNGSAAMITEVSEEKGQ